MLDNALLISVCNRQAHPPAYPEHGALHAVGAVAHAVRALQGLDALGQREQAQAGAPGTALRLWVGG